MNKRTRILITIMYIVIGLFVMNIIVDIFRLDKSAKIVEDYEIYSHFYGKINKENKTSAEKYKYYHYKQHIVYEVNILLDTKTFKTKYTRGAVSHKIELFASITLRAIIKGQDTLVKYPFIQYTIRCHKDYPSIVDASYGPIRTKETEEIVINSSGRPINFLADDEINNLIYYGYWDDHKPDINDSKMNQYTNDLVVYVFSYLFDIKDVYNIYQLTDYLNSHPFSSIDSKSQNETLTDVMNILIKYLNIPDGQVSLNGEIMTSIKGDKIKY